MKCLCSYENTFADFETLCRAIVPVDKCLLEPTSNAARLAKIHHANVMMSHDA